MSAPRNTSQGAVPQVAAVTVGALDAWSKLFTPQEETELGMLSR